VGGDCQHRRNGRARNECWWNERARAEGARVEGAWVERGRGEMSAGRNGAGGIGGMMGTRGTGGCVVERASMERSRRECNERKRNDAGETARVE
jgi:hypothetical protein